MRQLFIRCIYGHFFRAKDHGACCPADAWTHSEIARIQHMYAENPNIQIEEFAVSGIDESLLNRIVIIESNSLPASIEAIFPVSYVINGIIDEDIAREW